MQLSGLDLAIHGFSQNIRRIEKAGISYELNIIRDKLILGLNTEPVLKQSSKAESSSGDWTSLGGLESNGVDITAVEEFMDSDDEQYFMYLKNLNPNDYKNQDHYKVLGLSKLRWQANISQIRAAYRAKVLKYHPDKCSRSEEKMDGNAEYFACITKAYEQLGLSKQKRRAYDSVDPLFDDLVPDERKINSSNFYDILSPVFIRNARWSCRQPVPLLGHADSSQDEVDMFYSFWFDWDSWREFSYLDEEDKEKGEDRWERREIDKTNKVEREKRRRNEMKRIRNLIEMAYRKDPRVALFKEQEKIRKAKEREERKRILEERKAASERRRIEIESENKRLEKKQLEEEQQQRAHEKRMKEQQKKQLSEARRRLRKIAEGKNYWDADVSSKLSCLEAIEHVCLRFDVNRLNEFTAKIESVSNITEAMDMLNIMINEAVPEQKKVKNDSFEDKKMNSSRPHWSPDEIALLIKATNIYPSGVIRRWSEITDYINKHRKNKEADKKTEKDVVIQVRAIKSLSDHSPKEIKNILTNAVKGDQWSSEEQKLLESALKQYPSSDPERWDNIAKFVGKSRKECIERSSEVFFLVNELTSARLETLSTSVQGSWNK